MPNEQTLPTWQIGLAHLVGVIATNNLDLHAPIGPKPLVFDLASQLGYEPGAGLELDIGLILGLWPLLLRKVPQVLTMVDSLLCTATGTLTVQLMSAR